MKKGFTLIELLAILTLLGAIILVAVPSLTESNRVAENNSKTRFCETIQDACASYAAVNNLTGAKTIYISDLIDQNYLKEKLEIPGASQTIAAYRTTSVSIQSSGSCTCSLGGVSCS